MKEQIMPYLVITQVYTLINLIQLQQSDDTRQKAFWPEIQGVFPSIDVLAHTHQYWMNTWHSFSREIFMIIWSERTEPVIVLPKSTVQKKLPHESFSLLDATNAISIFHFGKTLLTYRR